MRITFYIKIFQTTRTLTYTLHNLFHIYSTALADTGNVGPSRHFPNLNWLDAHKLRDRRDCRFSSDVYVFLARPIATPSRNNLSFISIRSKNECLVNATCKTATSNLNCATATISRNEANRNRIKVCSLLLLQVETR